MREEEVIRNITVPTHIPVYSLRGTQTVRREVVKVNYLTDPTMARRLLPEPLEPVGAAASIQVSRYFDMFGDQPLIEISQNIRASFEGVVGDFVLTVYTGEVESIMVNRDLWILPILPGNAEMFTESGILVATLDVGSLRVLNLTASYKEEPLSAVEGWEELAAPKYCLRMNSGPMELHGRNATLLRIAPRLVDVESTFKCPVRMQMFDHVRAPLSDLPVLELGMATHTTAAVTPGIPEEIYRYSA